MTALERELLLALKRARHALADPHELSPACTAEYLDAMIRWVGEAGDGYNEDDAISRASEWRRLCRLFTPWEAAPEPVDAEADSLRAWLQGE